jgi:hypothetical protein
MGTKLKDHSKVKWPPNPTRVSGDAYQPTPGDRFDYSDAVLTEVCPLIPRQKAVELRVLRPGQSKEPLAIDVTDIRIREPLVRLLKKHTFRTIAQLGDLDTDF